MFQTETAGEERRLEGEGGRNSPSGNNCVETEDFLVQPGTPPSRNAPRRPERAAMNPGRRATYPTHQPPRRTKIHRCPPQMCGLLQEAGGTFSSLSPSQGLQPGDSGPPPVVSILPFPGLPLPTMIPFICLVLTGESAILEAPPRPAEKGLTFSHRNYLSHKK